jgi:hypothetical protein
MWNIRDNINSKDARIGGNTINKRDVINNAKDASNGREASNRRAYN